MEAQPTGQATPQPAIPESLNPSEAAGILSQMLESGQIQENGAPGVEPEVKSPQPRNEQGRFAKEAPKEEAQPATEAPTEEAVEEAPEPPKFSLKLNYKGEDKELVGEEQIREYAQKGYDYTQKMQTLAKEREELSAKVKAETEQARTQYEKGLEAHKAAIQKIAGVKSLPEIEQLSRTDPVTAQQEWFKLVAVNQAVQAIDNELAKVQTQKQEEAKTNLIKQARESVEKLQERIPGWNKQLYGKILEHAVENYGFSPEEANAITDHRGIEVLNKARLYDELMAAKPKTVEKKVPPVAPKVQKPGTGEKTEAKPSKSQSAWDQLGKTGRRTDAEAYVLSMLEEGKLG